MKIIDQGMICCPLVVIQHQSASDGFLSYQMKFLIKENSK